MARYQPIDMVDHYHGKICGHSDTYFQKRGDTLCTGRICYPRDLSRKPYSAREIATHEKFSQTIAAVRALTSEQLAAYETAYEALRKSGSSRLSEGRSYASLRGYIFAQEYAKLSA